MHLFPRCVWKRRSVRFCVGTVQLSMSLLHLCLLPNSCLAWLKIVNCCKWHGWTHRGSCSRQDGKVPSGNFKKVFKATRSPNFRINSIFIRAINSSQCTTAIHAVSVQTLDVASSANLKNYPWNCCLSSNSDIFRLLSFIKAVSRIEMTQRSPWTTQDTWTVSMTIEVVRMFTT